MVAVQAIDVGRSSGAGQVLIPPESTLVFEIELLAISPYEDPKSPPDIARGAEFR
jgi:hypothetical protein